jgi:hypothetical protein
MKFHNKGVTLRGKYSLNIPDEAKSINKRKTPNDVIMMTSIVINNSMHDFYSKYLPPNTKLLPFGPYAVREDGAIYSMEKRRWLKSHKNNVGYIIISLKPYDRPRMSFIVSRLVAQLYVTNRRPKVATEVHHIDRNKANSHRTNLKWVTHAENIQLDYDEGHRKIPVGYMKGKKHDKETRSKMSEAKIGERHPKFKGYYIYDGERYSSIFALAEKLGTYPQKAYRLFKKGGMISFESV